MFTNEGVIVDQFNVLLYSAAYNLRKWIRFRLGISFNLFKKYSQKHVLMELKLLYSYFFIINCFLSVNQVRILIITN
jgi:hypothetical protein